MIKIERKEWHIANTGPGSIEKMNTLWSLSFLDGGDSRIFLSTHMIVRVCEECGG